MTTEPYTFAEAINAARRASIAQAQAEDARRDASRDLAEAERLYRQALARQIVEVHANGAAWTSAQDLARGDDHVAKLRYERDIAKGVLDAAEQRAWRHTADRRDVQTFLEWSKARELAEGYGRLVEPAEHRAIGARAA